MNERSIFAAALDMADPVDRAAYLDRACAGDAALRAHIEELLAAQGGLGSFLNRPAAVPARTAAHEPLAEGPGSRVGPYKLLQEIGEGGMGTVFMAEQEEPVRRMVALKIIRAGMDSKGVLARFEAERQALALMDHPNIARVLDAGTTDGGSPYFVMELVKGVPITKFCDENQLSLRERLELFVPVCQAIQHAHMKGIIHRDIKPSNVLVAMYDDKPVPKVIDFGVAKATSQKLTDKTLFTAFGAVVGTLEYMSPEQAKLNQLDIDTRSDVYALGVLLYELLTGSTPLDRARLKSAALDEVLRLIREEEPQRPSTRLSTAATLPQIAAARRSQPGQLGSVVRGELDWIVMRCLEKDRTRRYDTAIGLARDLERYLRDEQVEACPPTVGYRLKKAYRRNRAAVLVGSTIAAVLLVATGVSLAFGVMAKRAEGVAEDRRQEAVANAERADSNARTASANEDLARQETTKARREQEHTRRLFYASEINHAFLDAQEFRTPRLTERLNAVRPKPGEADLRGWEWHYLDRQLHSWTSEVRLDFESLPERKNLFFDPIDRFGSGNNDEASIGKAFFTADGSRLVIPPVPRPRVKPDETGAPGAVFDVKTGKLLSKIASPRVDATLISSLPFTQRTSRTSTIAFSPDGAWMAYSEPTKDLVPPTEQAPIRVQLVELATGRHQNALLQDPQPPTAIQIAPGGQRVTAVWAGGQQPPRRGLGFAAWRPIAALRLSVWIPGQAVKTLTLTGPRNDLELFDFQLNPDGQTILLMRRRADPAEGQAPDGTIPITTTELVDLTTDPPATRQIYSIQSSRPLAGFSAGGQAFALQGYDRSIGVHQTRAEKANTVSVSFPPDISRFSPLVDALPFAVSDDGTRVLKIDRADLLTLKEVGRGRVSLSLRLKAGEFARGSLWRGLPPVHISADGSRILAACPDGTIQKWELPPRLEYAVTWPEELTVDGVVCTAHPDPNGPLVVYRPNFSGKERIDRRDTPLAIYDPVAGQILRRVTLKMAPHEILMTTVNPDGRRLLVRKWPIRESAPNEVRGDNPRVFVAADWSLWSLDGPNAGTELWRVHLARTANRGTFDETTPAITPDSRFLLEPIAESPEVQPVVSTQINGYRVRSAETGKESHTFRFPAGEWAIGGQPALVAGGTRFVVVTAKTSAGMPAPNREATITLTVRGFDAATGESAWEWKLPATWNASVDPRSGYAFFFRMTLAEDGTRLALVMRLVNDNRVWVLGTADGKVQRELRPPADWTPSQTRVALGPSGQVAVYDSAQSLIWDGQSPDPIARLTGFTWQTVRPVFSADGRRLFTIDNYDNASSGRVLRVWCLETNRELLWLPVPTSQGARSLPRQGNEVWIEGDRVYVQMADGVRVFDGSPRPEPKK